MTEFKDLKKGDIMTIGEAEVEFGIKASTLRNWRRMSKHNPDKFPRFAKIGGCVYVVKSEIIAHLNREFSRVS